MKLWLKSLLCITLSLMCIFTCVGYAAMSGRLFVSGSAQAEPSLPDVYISNVTLQSGSSVSVSGYAETILSTEIAAVGSTTFRVTVKNISDKVYVYERVLYDEKSGVTYAVSGIRLLDEVAPNGGEVSFEVTITVQSVPSDNSYALKFKFIEKTGTEILPGDDHLDVTFRYNNGQADRVVEVHINEFLERPEAPVKSGYTFIGWYTDETYTTAWNFEADKVIQEMTLYAGWVQSSYSVTFVFGNGSDDLVVTVPADSLIASPASPVREGYVFTGWHKADNTLWRFDIDKPTSNMTLYAGWEEYIPPEFPEYGIVFKPNNGEADTKIIVEDTEWAGRVKIPEPTPPVWSGYEFVGWYVDEALTTPWDFENDFAENHMTLFGKWEKVIATYTITFQPNNGAAVSTITVEEGMLIPTPTQPTREGYVFAGWYRDDLTTPWNFDTDKPVENMTLLGKWEKAQSTEPGEEMHAEFLGLVEGLLNGNSGLALNKDGSNTVYNVVQGISHSSQAPILHCAIKCIPSGTMTDLAQAANSKLAGADMEFVFMKDPNNKDRLFLYMYYASDCEDANKGDTILTYFQILSRNSEGEWYPDGTYAGTAVVGNYYGGHNNKGKTEWTIDVYTWQASARSVV